MSRRNVGTRCKALGCVLVLVVGLVLAVSSSALDVPYLAGRVNDLAEVIGSDAQERIEQRLESFEEQTGSQIAVLTIASLEGEALEDYSLRVAETWQLGRAEVDDGVLFLIARDDRKMRLEIGYGLEASVPDALAGRILDQVVRPAFRAGDFDGGIEAGVEAVITAIEGGDPLPEPSARGFSYDDGAGGCGAAFLGLVFLTIFGSFAIQMASQKGIRGWIGPIFHGGVASFLVGSIAGGLAGLLLFGLLLVLLILFRLFISKTALGEKVGKWARSRPSPSWSSGSSGGYSGGGFSGGGGSFGGGGSSSSW